MKSVLFALTLQLSAYIDACGFESPYSACLCAVCLSKCFGISVYLVLPCL